MPSQEQLEVAERERQIRSVLDAVARTGNFDMETAVSDAYDRGFEIGRRAGQVDARRVIETALAHAFRGKF